MALAQALSRFLSKIIFLPWFAFWLQLLEQMLCAKLFAGGQQYSRRRPQHYLKGEPLRYE